MVVVWVWATRIRNYSIVDVFWAFNFVVIAAMLAWLGNGDPLRKGLVCGIAALWGLRLGIYLAIRVFSHLGHEEGRYQQLRQEWSSHRDLRFFFFFQAQAVLNTLLSTPFFIIACNATPGLSALEYTGAALWLVSVAGEGIADWQLQQFRKDPANKGKVCTVGLWNYSRHPNYFFQLMIWVSVLLFALPSHYGWLAVICPLTIGYFLFRVTGIPMTEEQSLRTKGDAYRRYQQTTSAFIPWFRKK